MERCKFAQWMTLSVHCNVLAAEVLYSLRIVYSSQNDRFEPTAHGGKWNVKSAGNATCGIQSRVRSRSYIFSFSNRRPSCCVHRAPPDEQRGGKDARCRMSREENHRGGRN